MVVTVVEYINVRLKRHAKWKKTNILYSKPDIQVNKSNCVYYSILFVFLGEDSAENVHKQFMIC